LANAARVFDFIVSAVDAETLQGQTAERVIQSAKTLVAITGLNLQQIVTQMPAEKLATVRKYFA
jgi:uncharacterized membrane protein YcaP (DUF421 family)